MNKINYYHKHGLTVNKIAEKLKVSRHTVINYEYTRKIKIKRDLKKHEILKPIIKKLYDRGYNDSESSRLLNISRKYVNDIKIRYGLNYKKKRPLSKKEKSIIVGTLLGDAHLQTRGNSRLSLSHSTKQLEYCEWKASILKSFEFNKYFIKQGKYTSVKMDSNTDERLNEFSYTDKQINNTYLKYYNTLSLALHFMDDGCKSGNSYKIATCSFNKESLDLFNQHCKDKFNISWNYNASLKYPCVYLPVKYAKTFTRLINPFIHKSLEYKIHLKYL